MTQVYSGSYSINGASILQPTSHQWVERDLIGFDGNGRPLYSPIGDFELSWQLMSVSDLKTLIDAQITTSNTGTAVVDLPKWGDSAYLFYSYSGTYISRPTVGTYFVEYVEDVRLLITSIRTG